MALAELFTGIADAIREKDGTTDAIVANDFPERILEIETGYKIALSVDPPGSGTVSGGGRASEGMQVTVTATDDLENGYKFNFWKENNRIVSSAKEYIFSVTRNRDLKAIMIVYDFWFRSTTLPSSGYWNSVTYGNGKFVAVAGGNSNKSAYSEDGITWTETTLPTTASWSSVTYGNGKFLAVAGDNGIVVYSEDGITWMKAYLPYLPSSEYWSSVTYGNGKFVAISYSRNKAAYSEDGITWTETTLPSSGYWNSVTYGNGKFVAISYSSNKAAYSEDGITWTETTLPTTASWSSVTYGNGKFVAVAGNNSNKAAYSVQRDQII